MLKPFYQGKLDTFCAIYAVLNAFRLIRGIRTVKARDILNDVLMNLSLKPSQLHAVLTQETDYADIVDSILEKQAKKIGIEVIKPFDSAKYVSETELFDALNEWIGEKKKDNEYAVVLRFLRYAIPGQKPLNKHWTTADYIKKNVLHLFDCSHEAEAILNIRKDSFVTLPEKVDPEHLILIPPKYCRFLRLAG